MRKCLPLLLALVVSHAIAQRSPPGEALKKRPLATAEKVRSLTTRPRTLYSMRTLLDGTYVGSEYCIGCHTTGLRGIGQDANGEWNYRAFPATLFRQDDPAYFDYDHDGIADIVNVGCEACHGPGSQHILGAGDPQRIVNPEKLATAQANEVCGQCHLRVKSVPNGTHDWPYDDENGVSFVPGPESALASFFVDASGRWPDGIHSRQHHQQYFDFLDSPKPGFRFHPVKCVECHDSHGHTTNEHLIRDVLIEDDIAVPTRVDNGSLCLTCYASHGPFADVTVEMVADFEANRSGIGEIVSAHTHHPFAPERAMGLSRCTECHNPKVAKSAVNYDIRSHTFGAISPEKTLAFQAEGGMPNSCDVSCHAQKVNLFGLGIDDDISDWGQEFNRNSAEILLHYYGPEGVWWQKSLDEGER